MARIRTIKPEFFAHEGLFDLESSSGLPVRLAFAGLWTVADREGRFKWRPRSIKKDVLPYDDVDFVAVLNALEGAGFLRRYVVDGEEYGLIPAFNKHQHINTREAQSTIPAPDDACTETHVHARGKGREGKGVRKEIPKLTLRPLRRRQSFGQSFRPSPRFSVSARRCSAPMPAG
jgi:hypothetical protein